MSSDFDEAALRRSPFGGTVEVHAELGSTNDHARTLIAEDAPLPAVIVADRQTAGRGRGANRWWAADGALTFSVVVNAALRGLRPEQSGLVSLTTAVAVLDAVWTTAGIEAGVKWPNDVYLHGKKLAGVLNEAPRTGRLILGVGINVANHFDDAPDDVRARATSLADYATVSRQAVLLAFLAALDSRLTQIAANDPAPIEAIRKACVLTDQQVELRDGDRLVHGDCLGIADDGALRLATDAGVADFYAGTIERFTAR